MRLLDFCQVAYFYLIADAIFKLHEKIGVVADVRIPPRVVKNIAENGLYRCVREL